MTRSPRPRKTISDSLHRQLNMYAIAASATGVGAVALVQQAEARVIYTPAYHVIGKDSSFRIDLNHDGIADLVVFNRHFSTEARRSNFIGADPQASYAGILQTDTLLYFASFAALKRGARVGYGAFFVRPQEGHGILVAQCTSARGTNSAPPCYGKPYNVLGDWANVKNRYLGVKFPVNGKTHYGWVRLSVAISRKPFKAIDTLTGYAYETIPGKAIIAGATQGPDDTEAKVSPNTRTPEPATLGTLALGARGLSIWRREESVFAAPRPKKS